MVMVISVVGIRVGSVTIVGIVMVGSAVRWVSVGIGAVGSVVGTFVGTAVGGTVGTAVGSVVGLVVGSVTGEVTSPTTTLADTGRVQIAHSTRIMMSIMKNCLFTVSLPVL